MAKLLGISGSLRQQSYCTSILRSITEHVTDIAKINIFPLDGTPLYNEDMEAELPAEVTALRSAIAAADGIVIISPEYNHGISGVLKNTLDWASRPFGQASLSGKPVLTITSSIAFTGGVRAHAQLNETLIAIACRLVLRPQAVIGCVQDKVVDGHLTDEATLAFLHDGVADLARDIAQPSSADRQES